MNELEYKKLSKEEMEQRHILGRLVGIIADYSHPTRNGRLYGEDLWDKTLKDPLFLEAMENHTIIAQLEHPDYEKIEPSEGCACLAEVFKDKDGYIKGVWDILDLPNGRILKTLCDYGTHIGCSSRATGEVEESYDGSSVVTPESFMLTTWDMVLTPSVKQARLKYVNESLEQSTGMKKALHESLNNANENERKIMQETLDRLNIHFNDECNGSNTETDILTESNSSTSVPSEEAKDNGSEELIRSLQEALKVKSDNEAKIKSLQEELAVKNLKVEKLNEELDKYKNTTIRLSSLALEKKELTKKVSSLEEALAVEKEKTNNQTSRIQKLVEHRRNQIDASKALTESISSKDEEIAKLNESLTKQKVEYENNLAVLNKQLEDSKKSSNDKVNELTEKLETISKERNGWKKTANLIIEHYIDTKATMLGVSKDEIKNKLSESYSIKDIDRVCEDLQSYQLNISKLPFKLDRKVKTVQINESNKSLVNDPNKPVDDDFVDNDLASLAKNYSK